MTDDELKRIEALAEAAPWEVQGPWPRAIVYVANDGDNDNPERVADCGDASMYASVVDDPTAKFIAAARTAVPNLCNEVRRLRASLIDAERTIHGGPHEGGLVHKVARLEHDLSQSRADHVATGKSLGAKAVECERLQRENEALRGLLREASEDLIAIGFKERIDAALATKEGE